jgi:hypothetical protein
MIPNHLRIFYAALAIAVALGCGKPPSQPANLPSASGPTPDSPKQPVASPSKSPPAVFKLSALDYLKEWEQDRPAAKKKYDDKTLELIGVVARVNEDRNRRGTVELNADIRLTPVSCSMVEEQPWATMSPGQSVTIRGKATFTFATPHLLDCVVVQAGPNPAIMVHPQDLAKEYANDPDATKKKYGGKYLIIEGEIVDKKHNSDLGELHAFLKGYDKVRVDCRMNGFDQKLVDSIKVGHKVKVVGQLLPFQCTPVSIGLDHSLTIK